MPYTVHTLDGQAHTYPDPGSIRLTDAGLLTLHEDATYGEDYGDPIYNPLLAAYPAGQWTHYHVEPAPYETDYDDKQATREESADRAFAEAMDKKRAQQAWARQFQSDIDAGRKAAEAQ